MTMQADGDLALDIRGLSKTFGAQRALIDVSLQIPPGEVHALVGENGSGKSTLVKCLSGYHVPDPGGHILVGGRPLGPGHSAQHGGARLAFVHQDLGLIPTLSASANLFLGNPLKTGFGWRLRQKSEHKITRELLTRLGRPDIDPRTLVRDLPPASRAIVAIARCLHNADDARVVVLDEPTAPLAAQEVDILLDAVRRIAAAGHGVLYISHRLDEIFAVTDRITILRDGRKVATLTTAETERTQLVEMMLGDRLAHTDFDAPRPISEEIVIQAEGLSGTSLRDASFEIRKGEIIGVAGLQGCGKSELGELLFGVQRSTSGSIAVGGQPVRFRKPADAIAAGMAFVPANRHRDGIYLEQSVADNVTMLDMRSYFRGGFLRDRSRVSDAQELVDRFDVQPPQAGRLASLLSGGNQQKVVLAKWMHHDPLVLILDEPAQGIDVGAKARVFTLVQDAAARGTAVVVISEEIDDLIRLCDRILVLCEGRIVADLSGEQKTRARITGLVYGETEVA